jgi:hypothetical protein
MATKPAPTASTRWPSSASRPSVPRLARPSCSSPPTKGPPPADKARAAREAYYSGDVVKALQLAVASGETLDRGPVGLSHGRHAQAQDYFEPSRQRREPGRLAARRRAFWAARAASLAGRSGDARTLMIQAAHSPNTFYGMIAARQLSLAGVALQDDPDDPIAALISRFSYDGPDVASLNHLLTSDGRARRATALAQIGRWSEAGQELRAGLSLASDEKLRGDWMALTLALNARAPLNAGRPVARLGSEEYPLPPLEPKSAASRSTRPWSTPWCARKAASIPWPFRAQERRA